MTTTITNGTTTYELPAGLRLHETRANAAVCCDCGRFADAGERIVHSKRCDTETLQPCLAAADAPKPRFHRAKGKLVVKGLVQDVFAGATLEIDDQTVRVASCGRSWVSGEYEWVYGYLAETEAQRAAIDALECLECGAVEGVTAKWVHAHGMGCARCE